MQTLRQYDSTAFLFGESVRDLSAKQAKRYIITGGKKSVLPKANKKTALIKSGYSFKNTALSVKKHAMPTKSRSVELTKGRILSKTPAERFPLPERDVAARKNANPIPIIHTDSIFTGR